MIKVRLMDKSEGPVIWEFTTDQMPVEGLQMHYKGYIYQHTNTHHEVRDSGCDTVVYATLDTVVTYVCEGKLK